MDYYKKNLDNYKSLQFFDTEFTVAGLFTCTDLVLEFINLINGKFDVNVPIKYIYGAPDTLWNGGRVIVNDSNLTKGIENIENEIKKIVHSKVLPAITFNNHNIKDDDLNDIIGNDILKLIEKYGGKVIVASEKLEQYIRTRYPSIKIEVSVIRVALKEKKEHLIFYKNLEKRNVEYVIHPDDNYDLELFTKIDLQKCTVLLNEKCYYECKKRAKHYEAISTEQIIKSKGKFIDLKFLNNCDAMPINKQSVTTIRNISLSLSEYKKLYLLGIRKYKIQGRTDNLYSFFYDLSRYILDDDLAIGIIYPIFCNRIENFLNNLSDDNIRR